MTHGVLGRAEPAAWSAAARTQEARTLAHLACPAASAQVAAFLGNPALGRLETLVLPWSTLLATRSLGVAWRPERLRVTQVPSVEEAVAGLATHAGLSRVRYLSLEALSVPVSIRALHEQLGASALASFSLQCRWPEQGLHDESVAAYLTPPPAPLGALRELDFESEGTRFTACWTGAGWAELRVALGSLPAFLRLAPLIRPGLFERVEVYGLPGRPEEHFALARAVKALGPTSTRLPPRGPRPARMN